MMTSGCSGAADHSAGEICLPRGCPEPASLTKSLRHKLAQAQLLALDMDGTLLNQQKQITTRTSRALRHLQKHGVLITLITGRLYYSTCYHATHLQLTAPLGSLNGLIIGDCQGHILQGQALPRNLVADLLQRIRGYTALYPFLFTAQDILGEKRAQEPPHDLRIWNAPRPIVALAELAQVRSAVYQIQVIGPYSVVSALRRELEQHPEHGAFSMHGYASEKYPVFYLELKMAGFDKGTALRQISQRLAISLARTIAVGDWLNDISMLQAADLGIAMANAVAPVRAAADWCWPWSNQEEGVARLAELIANCRTRVR